VKIVIAPLAAQDLQEAYDFIARDNKRAADGDSSFIVTVLTLSVAPESRIVQQFQVSLNHEPKSRLPIDTVFQQSLVGVRPVFSCQSCVDSLAHSA
jgi:hypothetical protein